MSRQNASGSQAAEGVVDPVKAQLESLEGTIDTKSRNGDAPNVHRDWESCWSRNSISSLVLKSLGDTRDQRVVQCKVVMQQLVVMTMVLKALRKVHTIPEVYLQDPLFTEADVSFLESLGDIVLQNPAAYQEVTPTTFVFAPYAPNSVVAGIFSFCSPALYLGANLTTVQGDDTDFVSGDVMEEEARSRRAEVFGALSQYEAKASRMAMPVFDDYHWSRGLCLYRWG